MGKAATAATGAADAMKQTKFLVAGDPVLVSILLLRCYFPAAIGCGTATDGLGSKGFPATSGESVM